MVNLLFSSQGRINRGQFWLGLLLQFGGIAVIGIIAVILMRLVPGTVDNHGVLHVNRVASIIGLVLLLSYITSWIWSIACLKVKRYHDRGKSGRWLFIILIPFIGGWWSLIETGFFPGTLGQNKYGPVNFRNSLAYRAAA